MKTKDLIKKLQELDPEGDIECCVGNNSIIYVDKMPAYYDGHLIKADMDSSSNVISHTITNKGFKINFMFYTLESAIIDNVDHKVDTVNSNQSLHNYIECFRDYVRMEFNNPFEWFTDTASYEMFDFKKYLKEKWKNNSKDILKAWKK
jgi:hypothetical protein